MSAGMMPALDFPGLIRPGQFGPTMRVFLPCACAQNTVESCTGMPSVITTASGISASTASITADLAKAGGTKMTETSAPVSATASATVPKTGMSWPSTSTFSPALRGFTPPTILDPEASIRLVCFMPSEPVMPWTMILESSLRKIAMMKSSSSLLRGQLGGTGGGAVHGVDLLQARQAGLGQDLAAELGVVAVEPDHQRLGHGLAAALQQREGLHDAVGDRVARGDAAEHVHEHRLHVGVAQDDLQAVG